MSINNIVPIGCVKNVDAEEVGFVLYPETAEPIKNVEECIISADKLSSLCKDNKCAYAVYKDGEYIDLYRKANLEKDKSDTSWGDTKVKYRNKSLDMFRKIWLNFEIQHRNYQLNPNGIPFMEGYADWIKKTKGNENNDLMKWFIDNVNAERVPIQMPNICWIGGNNVLESEYTNLFDFEKPDNKNQLKCKYKLYNVPGPEGGEGNIAAKIKKIYQQNEKKFLQNARQSERKARNAAVMLKLINKNENIPLSEMVDRMESENNALEVNEATADAKKSIENKKEIIAVQNKVFPLINDLAKISEYSINKNIDLTKDKQKISDKINADIQTLSWSLEESENKEILQNKITTTLGIIIMLFAGLCIGLMIYYLIDNKKGIGDFINKSNKGIMNNIFGLNKANKSVSGANKKIMSELFS